MIALCKNLIQLFGKKIIFNPLTNCIGFPFILAHALEGYGLMLSEIAVVYVGFLLAVVYAGFLLKAVFKGFFMKVLNC